MRGYVVDLGQMPYPDATELQKRTLEEVIGGFPQTLFLVQHPPTITLGADFHEENLLETLDEYAARGVAVYRTERGGDVTFHGPGQLVLYPIFDTGRDLHRWLRSIEDMGIAICAAFGLEGKRSSVNTGVWVGDNKIAAIGVKVRRWISMHGMAFNCDVDLASFATIVPCGIRTHGVTSLSQELGRPVPVDLALPIAIDAFANQFDMDFQSLSREQLEAELVS